MATAPTLAPVKEKEEAISLRSRIVAKLREEEPRYLHSDEVTDYLIESHPAETQKWFVSHFREIVREYVSSVMAAHRRAEGQRKLTQGIFGSRFVANMRNEWVMYKNASKRDLLFHADELDAQANVLTVKAQVYRDIAKDVPEGKVVADVMTEEEMLERFLERGVTP
jgi:hypothetical protein